MRREPLGIGHKDLLYGRLRAMTEPIAEYSFANLYLFRAAHRYEVVFDRELFIAGRTYDGHSYLMPTVPATALDPAYIASLLADCDFLFPVAEAWLPHFADDRFTVSFQDGDSDYLYTTERIAAFPGKKLHGKRNLLHQFSASYAHEAVPLIENRMDDARAILESWQQESGLAPDDTDYGACREALDRYDELVLCGGIYYADGEPAGFVIGEELNDETFALHFAKARTKFKGAYQFIFSNFASILPKQYRLLNFEQDLDRENLRHAKSSYYPDSMLKKMRIGLQRTTP